MSRKQRALIIGGGFSGLATAALLAKNGWQVTLLEKNQQLGGRAEVLQKNGFSFDMGPSWYLMPEVFEKYFEVFDKRVSDYYQLSEVSPRYQIFFGDKQAPHQLTLSNKLAENQELFEQIEPGAGKKLATFLDKMEQSYQLSSQLLYENINDWRTWVKPKNIWAGIKLLRLFRFWVSWDTLVSQYFHNEKLKKILEFTAVFLGGSPFKTPALYSLLTWADFGEKVWYPQGGMGQVVSALSQLAESQGAQILTGQEVTQIVVEKGKAIGVITGETFWPAEAIIGATDLPFLETQLLPAEFQSYPTSYWQKKTLSISAMLLYLGLDKKLQKPVHHNLYFSANWQDNFQEIFAGKTLPSDPSFYLSIRSATDPTIVPKNSEELFVLVPLGAGIKTNSAQLEKYADQVIGKLESLLGESITPHLKVKEIFGPTDFADHFHAYQGTALGLAHTLNQSLWLRPGNQSHKLPNLYYSGQYTQPGVGVPMAIISAQLVANQIGKAQQAQDSDQIFRAGSRTYYYSSLFFRGQMKTDVFTLYAYVRTIDDFVDELPADSVAFDTYWQETQQAWKTGQSTIPMVHHFIELAKRKKFQWQWIVAFWDSMRSDFTKKNYSPAELETYIYGSAEVIGLMMAKILDLPEEASQTAQLQGKAMQLINFIRDVAEDEKLGRKYLPYTAKQKADPTSWAKFLRGQIEIFRQIQAQAEVGWSQIPRQYLIPIKTAAEMYKWTAQQLYDLPQLVWQKKVKPSKWFILFSLLRNFGMVW